MKYHIHIPKLLEFALNVVCDDITLRGKQFLVTPIPYPLYLRCIITYADKYDRNRYSIYRWYRDIRHNVDINVEIGRLYPNVLDHVVLDDDDVLAEVLAEVALYPAHDDAVASIHRFASRCLAADRSVMMTTMSTRALLRTDIFGAGIPLSKPIIDVLLFYGAKLDPNADDYFGTACLRGMNDDVKQAIRDGYSVTEDDALAAISSGNTETIELACNAYRGRYSFTMIDLVNATVEVTELCLSLNVIQRGTHYSFYNIPSFSVLQWILDHDVMEHDEMLFDIASNAASYSGHYFDMLRYLIEQRNFTVPRDVLVKLRLSRTTDLDVLDYLVWHGADVNAVDRHGWNVLECSPLLIRYWIDKGLVIHSNDANAMTLAIRSNVTAPVLEMMIDKYELNVNAVDDMRCTALHVACRCSKFEIVELLLQLGADVNARDNTMKTPYFMCRDDRIKRLLIQHGYEPIHE